MARALFRIGSDLQQQKKAAGDVHAELICLGLRLRLLTGPESRFPRDLSASREISENNLLEGADRRGSPDHGDVGVIKTSSNTPTRRNARIDAISRVCK